MNLKNNTLLFTLQTPHFPECYPKNNVNSINHLNEQLVKCSTEQTREMGILNGMKDLGLVHVAAEGMTNSGVSKGA